jgi:nicotinate phosphoribosyltransferase
VLINRLSYGVGTRLITSEGAPALDGVFKLVAIKQNNIWEPAIKISEIRKNTQPGHKKIWRLYDQTQKAIADVLSMEDEDLTKMDEISLHHPIDPIKHRILNRSEISHIETLHETIWIRASWSINFRPLRKSARRAMRISNVSIQVCAVS